MLKWEPPYVLSPFTSELVGLTFPFVLVEIRTHIFPGSEENLAGYHQRLVC